jgi:hypothetical protein
MVPATAACRRKSRHLEGRTGSVRDGSEVNTSTYVSDAFAAVERSITVKRKVRIDMKQHDFMIATAKFRRLNVV